MTVYREPPKQAGKRSIGNLDGASNGIGGTDTVRIQAGTGDFMQVAPTVKDNSYVSAKQTNLELKIQNVGRGSGSFARRESDGVTYSFRRIQGGDGVSITEVGDSILVSAATGATSFVSLIDAPSSFVGQGGKILSVDEANNRVIFIDAPQTSNRIHYGPTPPTVPEPMQGDGWWNTTDGSFFLYYRDANSGQWVESGASEPKMEAQDQFAYDYGAYYDGQPGVSEVVYRWRAPRAHFLDANFEGCLFTCGTNPSNDFACAVFVNGQQVGTWTINPAGASEMVSSQPGTISVQANQEIKIVAPVQTDATLADLVISFKGERF